MVHVMIFKKSKYDQDEIAEERYDSKFYLDRK